METTNVTIDNHNENQRIEMNRRSTCNDLPSSPLSKTTNRKTGSESIGSSPLHLKEERGVLGKRKNPGSPLPIENLTSAFVLAPRPHQRRRMERRNSQTAQMLFHTATNTLNHTASLQQQSPTRQKRCIRRRNSVVASMLYPSSTTTTTTHHNTTTVFNPNTTNSMSHPSSSSLSTGGVSSSSSSLFPRIVAEDALRVARGMVRTVRRLSRESPQLAAALEGLERHPRRQRRQSVPWSHVYPATPEHDSKQLRRTTQPDPSEAT